MVHRGPDDEGIFTDGVAGLGIRRLSVIDLKTGGQPLRNESGTIWTVTNGEIYNYKQLRADLEERGHTFYTYSDVEVVLHLYEEHGDRFPEYLNGMFGIALWDAPNRTFILVRDQIGVKPLYYSIDNERLLFGSELKSMLAAGLSREIDPRGLSDYLSYNYIPAPATIFRSAKKLEPGHLMVVRNGSMQMRKYWDLPMDVDPPDLMPEEEYADMIREALKRSIRRQLMADVPVGLFLSGGVDSSTLGALCAEVTNEPMRTFTIDFGEKNFSEVAKARMVAAQYGTIHRERTVTIRPMEILPRLAYLFDEPFADSSAIPTYYLSQLAREDVTVALGGDGGDELFAGYHTYTAGKLNGIYRSMPGLLSRTIVPRMINCLPVSHKKDSWDFRAKKFVQGALNDPARAHFMWKVIFDEQQKSLLCPFSQTIAGESFDSMNRYFMSYRNMDQLRQWQFTDTKVYLPDDILTKVDRMTMGNSLEGRVPFLDHEFVEIVARMPSNLKMKGLAKKYILKRAMKEHLPREILHGKKQGFSVPMAMWLRNELRDVTADYLAPDAIRRQGIFNEKYVSEIIARHNRMEVDFSRNIWGLLVFMLWFDNYGREPVTRSADSWMTGDTCGASAATISGLGARRSELCRTSGA